MRSRWVKGGLTIFGAVVLSTLGIFAADSLQGIEGGIGQFASVGKNAGVCVEGMVPVTVDGRIICADMYEASPSKECPHKILINTIQTEENASSKGCYAASVPEVTPWNYVTLQQAQRMCASAGKRLPTSREWYHVALGTESNLCTINGNTIAHTGHSECISSIGSYDAVGNVWEWVDEEVSGNNFNGRTLPEEGYVSSVDTQGVAVTSSAEVDGLYGEDYIWTKTDGVFGMIRGGFYGSGEDAGLYAVNTSVQTGYATQGVGFRCVKDVF